MKVVRSLCVSLLVSGLALAQTQPVLETTDMNSLTVQGVVQLLTGPGITIGNAKLKGDKRAAGSFKGGLAAGIGIDSGIIMSTGDIDDAAGPNTSAGRSGSLGSAGDPDLDNIVAPLKTQDATVLEFDFVTESEDFGIKYVFASEEYKEFVGSKFNDVFAFFLNSLNIALVPGTGKPVAINSVNHKDNTAFYVDNPNTSPPFLIEFDGFTKVLTAQASVVPGETYHIKLAIADTSDAILDSAVFLAQGGITGAAQPTLIADPREVFVSNGQSVTINLSAFALPRTGSVTLSASGLPEDSTVTFTPPALSRDASTGTATITIGPTTLPNDYIVFIRAGNERGVEVFTTVLVHVDCAPPFIFGLPDQQPNSQSVRSGQSATLRVVPQGSGPFTYQWFQGPSGSAFFPVEGARSAEFRTPPIVSATSFWVRVTNPCGSVDSQAALLTPTP